MSFYLNLYDKICLSGKTKKVEYGKQSNLHKHHVIPKHSNGSDEEENFTYLTIREHIIAHFLLWKIYRNPNDLRSMKMLGAKLTSNQRKIVGEWCRDNKIGIHGASSDDRSEWGHLGLKSQEFNGHHNSFWWWSTEEGRRKRSSLGGKITSKLNVGRIWIHKDNISKRIYDSDLEKFLSDGWSFGVGYQKSQIEIDGTKNRARSKSTCPHCGKNGQTINMKRWHFDNCKQKTEMGL